MNQPPPRPLAANICIQSKGSDSELYIQILNNYAWTGEIDFALIKGGLTYRYLMEDRRSKGGKERPTIWKSELQEKSSPLRISSDFVWRDSQWRVNYNHSNMVKRLSFSAALLEPEYPSKVSIWMNGLLTLYLNVKP